MAIGLEWGNCPIYQPPADTHVNVIVIDNANQTAAFQSK